MMTDLPLILVSTEIHDFFLILQHQLASLLKTAENLKIKGLAEVTSQDSNKDSSSTSLIPAPTSSSSSSSNAVTNATTSTPSSSSASMPSGSSPKKPKLNLDQATDLSLPIGGGTPNPSGSSSSNAGGVLDPLIMKRKRGRPRILDAPGEPNPFAQTFIPEQPKVNPNAALPLPSGLDLVTSTNTKIDHHDDSSNEPTPGGPLTPDRIKELGIIKMNDYLSTGTRQQFWEEYYVKVVMQVSLIFWPFYERLDKSEFKSLADIDS